jgi:hypothetical protein
VSFRGVLITSGVFEARRGGTFYGSVVARSLLLDDTGGMGTRFFRDSSLGRGWPPDAWGMPRFVITRFAVE